MSRKKRLFILPELKSTTGRKGEIWHIEYSYRCAKSDLMIRKRISKPLVNASSEKERQLIAKPIIADISQKLLAGWTPDDDEKNCFTDVLDYHQTAKMYGRKKQANRNVRFAASKFIDEKIDCKKSTIQNYTVKLRKFEAWCISNRHHEIDLSMFTNAMMLDFFAWLRDDLKRDASTIKYYRTMMWSFFEWARKNKFITENPVYDVKIPRKTTDYSARPILQQDANLLLDLIEKGDRQLYLACLFQYYTAIRPGIELRLLKIKDFDFFNNAVTVIGENAKNNKRQTIDIPKALTDICIEQFQLHTYNPEMYVFGNIGLPGYSPLSKNNMRERFNRFRDALNLPKHYKYYSFKHTGAGKFLNSGGTIEELRDHLRHVKIETTFKYIKNHFGERNLKVINHFPDPRS